jgi:hypothetical protein
MVDRQIFDLVYHGKFSYSDVIQMVPLERDRYYKFLHAQIEDENKKKQGK